jgi:V8-like Glu-specific endopeptidase
MGNNNSNNNVHKPCTKEVMYTIDEIRNAEVSSPQQQLQHAGGEDETIVYEEDPRKRVVPKDGDYSCVVGLIMAVYKNMGQSYLNKTTGTLINFYGRIMIFTCAHAVLKPLDGPVPVEVESATFFPGITEKKGNPTDRVVGYPIERWVVHPKYAKTGHNYKQGTDFAVLFLDKDVNFNLSVNNAELGVYNHDRDSQLTAKVYGYPAEKGIDPYEMDGHILKYIPIKKKRATIIYKDIYTTSGQSGGPVFIFRNDKWSIVGVHVAHDSGTNSNYATAITKDTYLWLKTLK